MRCLIFLFVFTIFDLTSVCAQISVGPEIGVNGSAYIVTRDGEHTINRLNGGVRAGIKADIGLTKHFSLQPGVLYVNNADIPSPMAGGSATSFNVHTIQIPLSLVYKANAGHVTTPFLGIGPYIGFNAGGKADIPGSIMPPYISEPGYARPLKIGSAATDDIKLLDVGVSVTAGLELPNGLYALLLYQKGIANQQPQGNASNAMKDVNFGISLGCFFHCSKKHEEKKGGLN